jgi:hypothetical protein
MSAVCIGIIPRENKITILGMRLGLAWFVRSPSFGWSGTQPQAVQPIPLD